MTVLLTISFFVLVVLKKIESKALKMFGYIIAVLLWIAAGLVFATGIYIIAKGGCSNYSRMSSMMRQGMMPSPMMPGMPGSMPAYSSPEPQDKVRQK
jgi:UPF0716 family protein affecting phage T7 exclusion